MDISLLKNRNVIFIILCLLVIALIYAVDIFPLAYNLTPWARFGDLPIGYTRLAYLEADTPNVISYREPGAADPVTCAEAVAYLETSIAGNPSITRCCQAETKISCLDGDFSADVPPFDEACAQTMREMFRISDNSLHVFAECPEGGNPEMTVVQTDESGDISWKTMTMFELSLVNSALRCILAPALLALAARTFLLMRRKPDPSRQVRRW